MVARPVVDSEGHLWVLHESEAGNTSFTASVHDPDGRFLGTVETPVMAVAQIGADFLAETTTDELGVQRAVIPDQETGDVTRPTAR